MPKKITIATVEPAERPRLIRPNWGTYLKDRKAFLHEAVAFSLNVSPKQMVHLVSENTTKTCRIYIMRLRAARLEMNLSGAITVIEEGRKNDGSDWIVDLKSFVAFALARGWGCSNKKFKCLGAESSTTNAIETNQKLEIKTPIRFVAALIRMLTEIATRAGVEGKTFNVQAMPGQRKDFQELANNLGNDYGDLWHEESTFNTYIKGLCQFKQGASRTDFYRNLFPEQFKIP